MASGRFSHWLSYWPGAPHLSGLGQPNFGEADGAPNWVTGKAGFWGALATWVWGQQLQPPGSWAPNLHMRRRR